MRTGGIRLIPHFLVFMFLSGKKKELILKDIEVWMEHGSLRTSKWWGTLVLLQMRPELRSIYYYRIGRVGGWVCSLLLPGRKNLFIWTKIIGPGFYIGHGWGTVVNAKKIGSEFSVFQHVTIGSRGGAGAVIGDRVTVAAHAIVLGDMPIGNNVIIGAGSVVVKEVADDSVIVPAKSFIIKQRGERVHIPL